MKGHKRPVTKSVRKGAVNHRVGGNNAKEGRCRYNFFGGDGIDLESALQEEGSGEQKGEKKKKRREVRAKKRPLSQVSALRKGQKKRGPKVRHKEKSRETTAKGT